MSLSANCYKLHAVILDEFNRLYQVQAEGDLYEVLYEFLRLASKENQGGRELREVQVLVLTKQHADKCAESKLLLLGPETTEEQEEEIRDYYWSSYKAPRVRLEERRIVILPEQD